MTQLFMNSHDALVFAFNFSSEQYGISEMARLLGPAAGSSKGLVGLDGAAQRGLIMQEVDRLDRLHKACIVARYSQKFKMCACCRNASMPLSEYKEAVDVLAEWSTMHITGISLRKVREISIRGFYEDGVSFKDEITELNVAKTTAYDQRALIVAGLKRLDSEAQGAIFPALEEMCGFS